jgi:hypothetical protein
MADDEPQQSDELLRPADDLQRPQWSEVMPSHTTLEQEAQYLVRAAATAGLTFRVMGGVAVFYSLGPESRGEFARVRSCPHDIDLLTRPKTSGQVKELFMSLGYVADERLNAWHGNTRQRYFLLDQEGQPRVEVDVFLGKPPLSHEIDFSERLDLPGPVMSATDLLLQKIQVHDATEKDLIDIAFLLAEFPLVDADDGLGVLSAERIAGLLARDWGFYHDASANLQRLPEIATVLPAGVAERAQERAAALSAAIEHAPKSRRWALRARVGTRAQWYEDVEELVR